MVLTLEINVWGVRPVLCFLIQLSSRLYNYLLIKMPDLIGEMAYVLAARRVSKTGYVRGARRSASWSGICLIHFGHSAYGVLLVLDLL